MLTRASRCEIRGIRAATDRARPPGYHCRIASATPQQAPAGQVRTLASRDRNVAEAVAGDESWICKSDRAERDDRGVRYSRLAQAGRDDIKCLLEGGEARARPGADRAGARCSSCAIVDGGALESHQRLWFDRATTVERSRSGSEEANAGRVRAVQPPRAPAQRVLALQRMVGNRGVAALMRQPTKPTPKRPPKRPGGLAVTLVPDPPDER